MTTKPDLEKLREAWDQLNYCMPLPWKWSEDAYYDGDGYECYFGEQTAEILNALPWLLEQAERAEEPKVCADCGCELTGSYVYYKMLGFLCVPCGEDRR